MSEFSIALRTPLLGIALATAAVGFTTGALADASGADTSVPAVPETFAIHGEYTYVEQETSSFNAPYVGPNSLTPDQGREAMDATLSVGRALWSGAELWINGEVDEGYGLDNTLGVAGFTSGEAYKVGANYPYFRVPRAFIRDTINEGGDTRSVEGAANVLGGTQSANRWVFTVGKFSVTDIFDNNTYAHDSRADFLNWSAIDGGAFDYAADAWGYTVGAAAEWYHGSWTIRAGVVDLSTVPNSTRLDAGFDEFQMLAEIEHRHEIDGHAGKVLITGFESRGRMGLLDQAVELAEATDTPVDIAAVRSYRSRFGGVVNFEQELTSDLGAFARYSKAAGNVEAYEFTDIDRSLEAGLSLKGSVWRRGSDTLGLAVIDNGSSAAREQYLNAGGLGILVGDGKLPNPGPEEIIETYYDIAVIGHLQVTLDYQFVENPGYNQDRGPVSVYAVRVHAQF